MSLSREQLVGSKQGGPPGSEASIQLVQGDTRGCREEAHIVMVHLDLLLDPRKKALAQTIRCMQKHRIGGMFICKADITRPEPAGPLIVLDCGIGIVD